MKKGMRLLALVVIIQLLFTAAAVQAETQQIYWEKAKSAVYDGLQDTILMYKNELYAGGFSLSTLQTTTSAKEADFVINTYSDLGANGVKKLNEKLEDPTDVKNTGNLGTGVRIENGGVYLVALHDGSFAKIRIDRILPGKVMFSYATENKNAQQTQVTQPTVQPNPGDLPGGQKSASLQMAQGEIVLQWQISGGATAWDLYRGEAGGQFYRLNDFHLTMPAYTDKSALADHIYYYKAVSYDGKGNKLGESGQWEVKVTAKETGKTQANQQQENASSIIVLQINNKTASVNGKKVILEVAPTIIDNTTMVPLRFISEALGATVDWNGWERRIALTTAQDRIILWIDKIQAQVNGKTVAMIVPATIVDGNTLVPVRFVSENFRQEVAFDANTLTITITGKRLSASENGKSSTDNASGNPENVAIVHPLFPPEQPADEGQPQADAKEDNKKSFGFYFHVWQTYVPGVVIEKPVLGTDYTTVEAKVGALSGTIAIKADGTYVWNSTWDGKIIEGKWEEFNDAVYHMRLMFGQENKNWLIARDGDAIILWDGNYMTYRGVNID